MLSQKLCSLDGMGISKLMGMKLLQEVRRSVWWETFFSLSVNEVMHYLSMHKLRSFWNYLLRPYHVAFCVSRPFKKTSDPYCFSHNTDSVSYLHPLPLSWELTLRFSQDLNVEQTSRRHITPKESFGHLPNPASYSFCSVPRYKAAVPQMTVLDIWIFLDPGFFLYPSFVPFVSKRSPNRIDSSSNMAHRPCAIPPVSCQSTRFRLAERSALPSPCLPFSLRPCIPS